MFIWGQKLRLPIRGMKLVQRQTKINQCAHTHTHTCTHTHTHTHTHSRTHIYMQKHKHTAFKKTWTQTYIHELPHTHIHTQKVPYAQLNKYIHSLQYPPIRYYTNTCCHSQYQPNIC